MRNIRNINIWKNDENNDHKKEMFSNTDIIELNLSVRSFNCLKRASCNTIQDVINYMGEDGIGLRNIRNLGSKSEREIIERIQEYKEKFTFQDKISSKQPAIIKPAKKIWDRNIDEFPLSNFSLGKLRKCGIVTVGDLYATNPKAEPGWYAVRELFEKIPSAR